MSASDVQRRCGADWGHEFDPDGKAGPMRVWSIRVESATPGRMPSSFVKTEVARRAEQLRGVTTVEAEALLQALRRYLQPKDVVIATSQDGEREIYMPASGSLQRKMLTPPAKEALPETETSWEDLSTMLTTDPELLPALHPEEVDDDVPF